MRRTRLRDRILPQYTGGEELVNAVSHMVGAAAGVLVMTFCLIRAIQQRDAWKIVSACIYGVSFIQLYVLSSLYHALRPGTAKKVLQVIDHCSIYFFITGTYIPVMLCSMRPVHPGWAWTIVGIVCGLTALAVTLTAIDLKKYSIVSMACYIGIGWCIVIAFRPLMDVLAMPGVWLMLAGGIVYTVGSVLYGIGKKHRYVHSVFHVFVLGGSVLQALCIVLYVI